MIAPNNTGDLIFCEGRRYRRFAIALRVLQLVFAAVCVGEVATIPYYTLLQTYIFQVATGSIVIITASIALLWAAVRARKVSKQGSAAVQRWLRPFVHFNLWTDLLLLLLTFGAASTSAGIATLPCSRIEEVADPGGSSLRSYVVSFSRPGCGAREQVATAFMFGLFVLYAIMALLSFALWRDWASFSAPGSSIATGAAGAADWRGSQRAPVSTQLMRLPVSVMEGPERPASGSGRV